MYVLKIGISLLNLQKESCQPKLWQFGCLLSCFMWLSSCAYAPWERGLDKKELPQARVERAQVEAGNQPDDMLPRKQLLLAQELSATQLLAEADKARKDERYEEALKHYDQVLQMLPDDQSALMGKQLTERAIQHQTKLKNANELFEKKEVQKAKSELHQVIIENPRNDKALALAKSIQEKSPERDSEPAELKPPTQSLVNLELRDANIRTVFEALSRATGINFILDKDIKPDTKASIFVKKARVLDAIDMVLSSNGLQKKALSDNTALIYPATPVKQKDYQDLMIRSFYLSNSSAKQVATLVKTMLKTKDVYVDDRLNMLVMRDTPEAIRIAEKLVASSDMEDPEVMLDIEVLEVSRSRLQELGIVYPNQLSVISSGTLTLEALKAINSASIGVSPNPGVNFKKTLNDLNLLSNPRIRVKNNEKAKVLVGDKVPIVTTTSTANVGVSENVQYVDVGLKLEIEPRIALDNYVNIKVGLEVSSLGERTVTRNGAIVFNIGTRNASTVLRLKHGETQVLAGLISDEERKNAQRLPGLGDIPLLGRLFANQEDKKAKTEIVLAITPRVINNVFLPNAAITEYWSGTENVITDKPLLNIPAVNTGDVAANPQDKMRELIRQRRPNLPQSDDVSASAPVAPSVSPDGSPATNAREIKNANTDMPVAPTPPEETQTPTVNPGNN